jgi:hypothetical protein
MPSLSLHFCPSRKPRHAALDQERADLALARARVHDERVAERLLVDAAVGDERLGAVDHVGVAVAARARRHREHVGAHARLGHAHAADPLSRGGLRQHALALHVVAVDVHVLREQHRVREHREREPGVEVESASHTCAAATASSPAPPYSSGSVTPSRPSSPARRNSARLKVSSRSCAAACGSTSRVHERLERLGEQRVLGSGRGQIELSMRGHRKLATSSRGRGNRGGG